ncbi:T-lymphocyte surface antigen Ly-9 [Acipenser ruthenus]|uniref:T-lymphocyte surface antigen Ly-9 n=1 Tax=Acipenser ruthenus TaxID=7906 RepID=A0A444UY04_ACIRT|nr:T-lymphocyte surface antigen Ly-9 [Acipenser ruthenus]
MASAEPSSSSPGPITPLPSILLLLLHIIFSFLPPIIIIIIITHSTSISTPSPSRSLSRERDFHVLTGQLVPQQVKGIVGESFTFPVEIPNLQPDTKLYWRYGSEGPHELLARIQNWKIDVIVDRFEGRLQLDNNSLRISELKIEDSSFYQVEEFTGNGFIKRFQLSVYNPVPIPHVQKLSGSEVQSNEMICILLCSVQNSTALTVSWIRDGESLHTPQLVLRVNTAEYNVNYTCVASNPVSNQTVTVTPSQNCMEEGFCRSDSAAQQVKGILRESFTFPVKIPNLHPAIEVHWSYGPEGPDKTIASIQNRMITVFDERFKGRLQLDSNSSSLRISELKTKDSGFYQVEEFKKNGFKKRFSLTVYNPVPIPHVQKLSGSEVQSNETICILLCSVQNSTALTVSWIRDGESLHTPQLVLRVNTAEYNVNYTCVASNPVSNQTVTVTPSQNCTETEKHKDSHTDGTYFINIIFD